MIVEFVQFKYPPGWSREQILADARTSVPRWRDNQELVRKHYIAGEDGAGGAFYIWPSKQRDAATTPNGSPTSRRAPGPSRRSATSI